MASSQKPDVGFVGLGAMVRNRMLDAMKVVKAYSLQGFGMATHLVKQGYSVTGFDVFPQALERFTQAGGKAAASIAESAKGKAFYICMVASAAQLEPLMFEGAEPLISGKEMLNTSNAPL